MPICETSFYIRIFLFYIILRDLGQQDFFSVSFQVYLL